MNFEDLSNSGLTLGLDYSERPQHRKISQVSLQERRPITDRHKYDRQALVGVSSSESDAHQFFPLLDLALSLEPRSKVDVELRSVILERQVSSISVVSSLSNSDILKSKRDVRTSNNQESEAGRVVLDHDQDEDESGVRKKLKLDRYQSRVLEDSFKDHSTLNLVSNLFFSLNLYTSTFKILPPSHFM